MLRSHLSNYQNCLSKTQKKLQILDSETCNFKFPFWDTSLFLEVMRLFDCSSHLSWAVSDDNRSWQGNKKQKTYLKQVEKNHLKNVYRAELLWAGHHWISIRVQDDIGAWLKNFLEHFVTHLLMKNLIVFRTKRFYNARMTRPHSLKKEEAVSGLGNSFYTML